MTRPLGPAPTGAHDRAPGISDALRATVGVICAYATALVIAGLVGLISGAANEGVPSAGDVRAQLAIQAVIFAGAALLLVDGLLLSHAPRERNPLAAAARDQPATPQVTRIVAVGLAAAVLAHGVGPLIGTLWPGLHDTAAPVNALGVGTGLGADLGTIVVVAGLVPLGEELLFRGVLVGAWSRAGRPAAAIVISAVMFGLAHATVGHRAVVVAVVLGVLLAAAMLVARSLGAAVLAHSCINAAALISAGLTDPIAVAALVAVVIATTIAATQISRSVSSPLTAGTLNR